MVLAVLQRKSSSAPRIQSSPWGMILLGALFYAFQFVIRVSPAIMTGELRSELHLDATFLGTFTSCYYIAYATMLIPLGLLLDRMGPHRIFPICSLILALSILLFASTSNFYIACLARLLVGASGACGFVGTMKLGTLWIRPRQFGQVVALATVFGTFGAIFGARPLQYLFSLVGWRGGMMILAGCGLLLTLSLHYYLKAPQEDDSDNKNTRFSALQDLKLVLTNSQVWLIGIYAMLMYMPITILGDLWGIPFVIRAYNVPKETAAAVVSAMFIGVFFGSPGFVYLSNRLESRRIPLILGAILCCLATMLLLLVTNQPLWVMYPLFFAVGLFFGSKSVGFAAAVENLPRRVSGLTIGAINALIMLNGVYSLPLVGWLLDFGKKWYFPPTEQFVYTISNFRFALLVIPVAILISLVLVYFTKESFPKK